MSDALLLCRVSDAKQEDGYSLDAQERFGKEYCAKNGFNVLEIFSFVETGSKSAKRNKFDGMMDYIRIYASNRKARTLHLIVEKPDRLTRNFTNREQLQFFVMTGCLVIHYYKDKRILDRNCSPADIFTDDMMTSVSKYIALNIAREARKGMLEKAKTGWFPAHAPLGYKNIREGSENRHGKQTAKIVPDLLTKKTVQRIFELRALKGYSYDGIFKILKEEDLIPTTRTKTFTRGSVEKILINPFYGGRYVWEGKCYDGNHELIVPKEWVELAQTKRGTANKPQPVGVFSYFLKCDVPECGCSIIYDPKIKTNKGDGKKHVYHYYHCADGKRLHKFNGIKQVNVAEGRLWSEFEKIIAGIQLTREEAELICLSLNDVAQIDIGKTKLNQESTKSRLSALSEQEDALYDHWVEGALSKEAYDRKLAKLNAERAELENTLSSDSHVNPEQTKATAEILLELCKSAEVKWEKGSDADRIAFVKRVCSNPRLSGATIGYDLKPGFKTVSQLKLNRGSERWYPGQDLNLQYLTARGPEPRVSTSSTTRAQEKCGQLQGR